MRREGSVFTTDVVLLLAASFFYMASPMLVTPLVTGFSESLGAGALVMGIVGGLTNLCSLLLQPLAGGIADRVSKYRLGCVGVSFLIVACLGYVLSQRPWMVLLFRAINGFGFAFCSVCFSTWIANVLPPDKIGYGMGLYGMMNALAMAISPSIGVVVYQRVGYRAAFVVATAFAVLCVTAIQFCRDKGAPVAQDGVSAGRDGAPGPQEEPATDGERPEGGPAAGGMRLVDARVVPYALSIMCFAIPYCATQSFIVRYSEARGLGITVSLFFTIYAVALLLSRMVLSRHLDKVPFRRFLLVGSVSALLSITCLALMGNDLVMALGAAFMAGGYGLMCTVAQSAAVTSVEPQHRGLANGTYYIGLNSGMALGPMIGGLLYGAVPLECFYPLLALSVPVCLVLYWASRRILGIR